MGTPCASTAVMGAATGTGIGGGMEPICTAEVVTVAPPAVEYCRTSARCWWVPGPKAAPMKTLDFRCAARHEIRPIAAIPVTMPPPMARPFLSAIMALRARSCETHSHSWYFTPWQGLSHLRPKAAAWPYSHVPYSFRKDTGTSVFQEAHSLRPLQSLAA